MGLSFIPRVALIASLSIPSAAFAQKSYDTGATDTEIKIGITLPLSGPASAYGVVCPLLTGYFQMLNEAGGVNGRKLTLICEDDEFTPAKSVEKARKLVESDGVLFIYNSNGTSASAAAQPYLTSKKVPQLLINSGASRWSDPKKNPWATTAIPHYHAEAVIFGRHIATTMPNAKVGILYQADDYGKDYLNGLTEGLGEKAKTMLVAKETYEVTDPTVDSQILQLKESGVDVVVLGTLSKQAAQAIRKIGQLDWKPQLYLSWSSSGVKQTLVPGGLEQSKGTIGTAVIKYPEDPKWKNDPEIKEYREFMSKYYPGGDVNSPSNLYVYAAASVLTDLLTKAGDNLTHENIRNLAQHIDMRPKLYMPGVVFKTTPDDLDPIKTFQLMRFNGERWELFGDPISP